MNVPDNFTLATDGAWEGVLNAVADRVRQSQARASRWLIGICGPPGSGKTTIANALVRQLSSQFPGQVTSVAQDGFHYTRAELDSFPNPEEAHRRRGAPWTFNVDAFRDTLTRVKFGYESEDVEVPGFDHAEKDPSMESGRLIPMKKFPVCIVEGNYVGLNFGDWKSVVELIDEFFFLKCALDEVGYLVADRHLAAGIVSTFEQGFQRWVDSDRPNAEELLDHLPPRISLVINTIGKWKEFERLELEALRNEDEAGGLPPADKQLQEENTMAAAVRTSDNTPS